MNTVEAGCYNAIKKAPVWATTLGQFSTPEEEAKRLAKGELILHLILICFDIVLIVRILDCQEWVPCSNKPGIHSGAPQ
jgi:hypothetical protein